MRKFSTEICVSTGRSGAGCNPCTTQDPLWEKLDQKTKYNKKGARADFPKKVIHLLPVMDLTTGNVRILKGGNKTFENMGGWLQTQSGAAQDLRRCEWNIWKVGKGMTTTYHTVRSDATPFQVTPEMEAEIQAVMARAMDDLAPMKRDVFLASISGEEGPEDTNTTPAFAPTQPAPIQPAPAQAPAFTPASAKPLVAVIPTAPVASATTGVLEEFTAWCNGQPELQGMGAFNNLIPILQAKLGSVNYHACTPEQLADLRVTLQAKLDSIRK
jgi:hypothetical protein